MMKKAAALFLCFALFCFSACGRETGEDASAVTDVSATQAPEPITSADLLSANESYGRSDLTVGFAVRDESVQFRTQDSYRLESNAVRAAQDALRDMLALPDSLQILDCNIWNCVDDGDCTYYSVHLSAKYLVGTGEWIERGFFYDVGVRKADESTFDASGDVEDVLEAYSVFSDAKRNAVPANAADSADDGASAAQEIAVSRLKRAQSGRVISAKIRADESDDNSFVWDVLCEGENDFGMTIPDIYTVYLFADGDGIREADPAADQLN